MEITKEIETATASIALLNNKIIRLAIKDDVLLQCDNLEDNYNAYNSILNGKPAPFLILVNDSATISTEGRAEFNAKGMKDLRLADALIIKSPATMLLINSQVNFVKPLIPLQAFIAEAEGVRWLQKFIK